MTDAFDELFVDGAPVLDGAIVTALKGRLQLVRQQDDVVALEAFHALTVKKRIVLYGLARHVMARTDATIKAPARAEAYANVVRTDVKSCREILSRLKGDRVFDRGDGGYYIPTWAIGLAMKQLG